ncbi:MAG: hypothetical protein E7378_01720 [Clostridiales bacterium]|nr:hypothetical protein [Clostridiales bacterium]
MEHFKKLTEEDIEKILNLNNMALARDVKSNDGELLPAVERLKNMIVCRVKKQGDPLTKLIRQHPLALQLIGMVSTTLGPYSSNSLVIIEKDCMYEFAGQDKQAAIKLNKTYLAYMKNKFPDFTIGSYDQSQDETTK